MIQHFIVKSTASPKVLCEFRTDGNSIEYMVDNTDGNIQMMLGKNFAEAKEAIRNSSHITMEPSTKRTHGYFRYLLDNGDTVEITADGLTCLVNGQLVNEQQKNILMDAIVSGQVTVKNKANINSPTIVPPYRRPAPAPKKEIDHSQMAFMRALNKNYATMEEEEKEASSDFDHRIERADYSNSEDPSFSKSLGYLVTHGKLKGSD